MAHATYLDQVWKKGSFYVGFYNMQATADAIFSLLYTSNAAWNETRWNNTAFDKLVFDDLKHNATLVAMLAYLASEDPQTVPRVRRVMPVDQRTGEQTRWPDCQRPPRKSSESTR